MDCSENSFVSQLRQPSRILSPEKLVDVTASVNNARSTMLPPPSGALKRKTLAETAGEVVKPKPAPPSSRPVNATVKATTIAGLSRQTSYSSSTSSRPPSASSMRNVSNTSFSSSVGGARPPSSAGHRPHASTSSYAMQKPAMAPRRPASSFDNRQDHNRTVQANGNRDSMTPFHSPTKEFLKLRECASFASYEKQNDSISNWSSSVASSTQTLRHSKSLRDISLTTALGALSLNAHDCVAIPEECITIPTTPSHIPKRKMSKLSLAQGHAPLTKSPRKTPKPVEPLLNRFSNIKAPLVAWDTESRLENVEHMYSELEKTFEKTVKSTTTESNSLRETIGLYKARISEMEVIRTQLTNTNNSLQQELDAVKARLASSSSTYDDARRNHSIEIDDVKRQSRRELEEMRRDADQEARRLACAHRDEMTDLRRRLEDAIEDEKARRRKEVQELSMEGALAQQKIEVQLDMKDRVLHSMQDELEQSKADVQRERDLNRDLRDKLSDAAGNALQLEASMRSLRARVEFLESDCKSQSQAFADLEQKTQDAILEAKEAKDKLRIEETLRRKLHNQVQELKGNIRVFCRVRPSLESDPAGDAARISFPDNQGDSKEVEILGPEEKSSLGNITTKKNIFAFDRVFAPESQNADVFDEISQLVQSALDGYNVCIFCYGQTGAGKTFTMSSEDGMIPRAVRQIYDTAKSLEDKGWRYSMEGSFVEVYNENINDLLGKAEEFDKKKHEIRHDMQKCKTTITDITTVDLDSPNKVETILRKAMSNRSVAATKANERSSRSHSVFILKLNGENSITGEKSEGTLNLVDLAGSERLSHSGSTGERLKETQNINKSLSCLGDVIGALGQGKEGGHVPYRNSKLTYLLQFSLGGNSKTLMFVMISPLQAHLSETLTSLKFATKVHNTHIGTAKRQAKIRDT
ncbi:kinesin-like nuclear fusion protein [Trapelia coarctata]|nr:kinesin-like nuclear fusion protein [Trapelia coarctata]